MTQSNTKAQQISYNDMLLINKAITNWILGNCRPYEIVNDAFFTDLVKTVLQIGARYGKKGILYFDLSKRKHCEPDSVRYSLDRNYNEIIAFWKPLLKSASELNLLSFSTDLGKDKVNKRAMVSICCSICFPMLPEVVFNLVLATRSYESALLRASADNEQINMDEIAREVYSKNAVNIRATFESILKDT